MAKIQLKSFRYKYDYRINEVTDKGDYIYYPVYTTQLNLRGETPPINKYTGKVLCPNRNTFGVIELCVPIVNYALAGNKGTHLATVLGMKKELMENIITCGTFYDMTTGTDFVTETHPTHKYLVGGQYLYKLIQEFDFEAEIYRMFKVIAWKCLKAAVKKGQDFNTFLPDLVIKSSSDSTENRFLLADDYYINPAYEEDLNENWEARRDRYIGEAFASDMSRLYLLLNTPRDKSSLYGMIAPFVIVLPYDYRRSTGNNENKAHPTTVLYQHIMEANASLLPLLQSGDNVSPRFADGYKLLTNVVNAVYYNRELSDVHGEKTAYKSILQALSGKKGIVRSECLGKRQDYSGRSVVSIKPDLSLTSINLPKTMILSMFEYHALPELYRRINAADSNSPLYGLSLLDLHSSNYNRAKILRDELFDIITKWPYENGKCMLKCIPVFMGRQPTLHKHSFQSFFVGVSETNTIQVNPLVCPGYNMDFDGDQAYTNIPIHKKAIKEVAQLMATPQTIYLAKTGESTIEPRQDMLYGLYMCTREDNLSNANATMTPVKTYDAAYEAITSNTYAVWDKCIVNGKTETLGDAAFIYCFAPGDMASRGSSNSMCVKTVDKHTIGKYVDYILSSEDGHKPYSLDAQATQPGTFVGTINHLVRLGFAVAKYYPPSVSLVDSTDVVGNINVNDSILNYETCLSDMSTALEEAEFFYDFGFDTQKTYEEKFRVHANIVKNCIEDGVKKAVKKDNGYLLMADSGARGNTSNLAQIFKYKGQIQKNSTESFNAIIEHGYMEQLSPMEFFVNSYGGRQGQIDKSLKTADTGYYERSLWHAANGFVITTEDCGTTDGIDISYEFIQDHCPDGKPEEMLADWLEDHHLISIRYKNADYATNCNNELVTRAKAKEYAQDKRAIYKIRSPLTCKNPCCVKCYGIDPSTHLPPVIGTAVGLVAAQSVGEISTQATMKTFQKGGASGASSVSSAFDRAKKLVSMSKTNYQSIGYDPVAWGDGKLLKLQSPIPGTSKLRIIDAAGEEVKSPVGAVYIKNTMNVQTTVKKGVGIAINRGDYSVTDLEKIMGTDYAQIYLVAKLRDVYGSVATLKYIHLEILVAALTRYLIISTDRNITKYAPDGRCIERALKVGAHVTAQELLCGSLNGTKYIKKLMSYSGITLRSLDMLDTLQMEELGQGVARSTLLHADDTLNKPINRIIMAKGLLSGSHLPTYIDDTYRR